MNYFNELKNQAAYIFAKWLTEQEHNLDFVTQAGYLPVTDSALNTLFNDITIVENEEYHGVYKAVDRMNQEYSFYALPLYSGASEIQNDFEKEIVISMSANILFHVIWTPLISPCRRPMTTCQPVTDLANAHSHISQYLFLTTFFVHVSKMHNLGS